MACLFLGCFGGLFPLSLSLGLRLWVWCVSGFGVFGFVGVPGSLDFRVYYVLRFLV